MPLRVVPSPLEGTRRVEELLGVAGRLSRTVSPFRAEQGSSLAAKTRGFHTQLDEGPETP